MNPNQIPSSDEQNVVDFSESPGRRLRVQRQAKGLELERIAAQLHLRPAMVEALEQDHYADLPGPVFIAGYLRNYARLLGLDPEPIVAAYRATNPDLETRTPRISQISRSEIGSGHILVRLVSLALVIAVIAMLALWWQNRPATLPELVSEESTPGLTIEPRTETEPALEDEPLPASSGAMQIPESPPAPATSRVETPAPTPAPTQALALTPEPVEAPTGRFGDQRSSRQESVQPPSADEGTETEVAETASQQPDTESSASGEIPVALAFSGPCWIDVRDASGAVVLTGEMAKGDQRVLTGSPPYSFVIGNASATTLTIGDKPFDLQAKARGNVARFKLTPEAAQ